MCVMDNPDTLAGRLTRLLAHVPDLDLEEIDNLAGLAPGHTGLVKRSVRKHPSGVTLAGIGRVLGASVEWLVEGRGVEPSGPAVRRAVAAARAQPATRRAQRAS